jgi:hypothetical protein
MRQHRGLHFVGVLGLLACAGWSQPASAQATAITSSPAPLSPFGDCNTTDPKTFDPAVRGSCQGRSERV